MTRYKVFRKVNGEVDALEYVTTDLKDAIYRAAGCIITDNTQKSSNNSKIYNYVVEKYEEKKKYGILRVGKKKETEVFEYSELIENNLTKEEALKHINKYLLNPEFSPKYYYYYRLISK